MRNLFDFTKMAQQNNNGSVGPRVKSFDDGATEADLAAEASANKTQNAEPGWWTRNGDWTGGALAAGGAGLTGNAFFSELFPTLKSSVDGTGWTGQPASWFGRNTAWFGRHGLGAYAAAAEDAHKARQVMDRAAREIGAAKALSSADPSAPLTPWEQGQVNSDQGVIRAGEELRGATDTFAEADRAFNEAQQALRDAEAAHPGTVLETPDAAVKRVTAANEQAFLQDVSPRIQRLRGMVQAGKPAAHLVDAAIADAIAQARAGNFGPLREIAAFPELNARLGKISMNGGKTTGLLGQAVSDMWQDAVANGLEAEAPAQAERFLRAAREARTVGARLNLVTDVDPVTGNLVFKKNAPAAEMQAIKDFIAEIPANKNSVAAARAAAESAVPVPPHPDVTSARDNLTAKETARTKAQKALDDARRAEKDVRDTTAKATRETQQQRIKGLEADYSRVNTQTGKPIGPAPLYSTAKAKVDALAKKGWNWRSLRRLGRHNPTRALAKGVAGIAGILGGLNLVDRTSDALGTYKSLDEVTQSMKDNEAAAAAAKAQYLGH